MQFTPVDRLTHFNTEYSVSSYCSEGWQVLMNELKIVFPYCITLFGLLQITSTNAVPFTHCGPCAKVTLSSRLGGINRQFKPRKIAVELKFIYNCLRTLKNVFNKKK